VPAGPYFAATGHDPDLREAAREALRGVLDYLERERSLKRTRAYILASACVDLKISQLVDAPNWTVSAFLPLSIFPG
jgi:acetamidase/formamidase